MFDIVWQQALRLCKADYSAMSNATNDRRNYTNIYFIQKHKTNTTSNRPWWWRLAVEVIPKIKRLQGEPLKLKFEFSANYQQVYDQLDLPHPCPMECVSRSPLLSQRTFDGSFV